MTKKLSLGILSLGVLGFAAVPRVAMANEGVAMLRGSGVSGACFATSVFVDGSYRVLATCRDLKTALSPEKNRYVAWVTTDEGKQVRLGEIANGKLSTSMDSRFVDLFVTAETDGYGLKPSTDVLLSGPVQAIDFGVGIASAPLATPTPTNVKNVKVTPTQGVDKEQTAAETTSGVKGALSTVLKIALFGFGALLLVVGVFSFLSRRRSL